jgi:hypothetical protein
MLNTIIKLEAGGLLDNADCEYLKLCYSVLDWNLDFIEQQLDRVFGSYLDSNKDRKLRSLSAFSEQLLLDNISGKEFKRICKEIERIYKA